MSRIHMLIAGTVILATLSLTACASKRMSAAEPMEQRAVWVLLPQLEGGRDAVRENLRNLKQAGANVLCVVIQKRGYVLYPDSASLPQLPSMAGEDIFPWLIRDAHSMGLKVEAWTEYGFYAYHTPDASKDPSRGAWLDAHPELAGVDAQGNTVLHNDKWGDFFPLDAANPAAQDLLLDLYTEIVRRYPFDGINLDRIRYATATNGYSNYCRETFKADTGLSLDDAKPGNPVWKRWREWRKAQLTDFMDRASGQLRSTRPGLRITMATVPPESIDDLGQNWPLWLERGYLDAAYPMLYGANPEPRFEVVRRITNDAPNVYAGLDLTVGVAPFRKAVEAWRAMGYQGVTIWQSTAMLEHKKAVHEEVFPKRTKSPLYND